MIKLSVIVPVYNMEKYIERCLDSLVNQILEDMEIIIVNDGSYDNSKEIINKYLREYDNIKYYEKENGGLSSARNYGLDFAKGEYIAFLDSDDYVEKTMYEEMYNLAKAKNADIVECDFIWEWENRKKYDKRREYKNKKEMMKKPRVVAWNKIIKRDLIEKNSIRFPEGLIYEDLEFFYKLIPYVEKYEYINKYFVHYTQREDSISNTHNKKTADIFKILNNIFLFYNKRGLYDEYKKELNYMRKRILFGSSMKRILRIKNRKLKRNLISETFAFLFKNRKEYGENNKIVFGITKLGIGGAERVLVDMANNLSCNGYDITIFTIYSGGELEKDLNDKVKLKSIYDENKSKYMEKSKITAIYVLLFKKHIYNKYLRNKYDTYIAFLEGPITRILMFAKNNVAWVHNDIGKVFGNSLKAKIKKKIDKKIYGKYEKIVFVSKQNKEAFEELYGNISKREVIKNYIDKERIKRLAEENTNEKDFKVLNLNLFPSFVTVARLVKQKGIDRFIRVHKKLIDEGLMHKVYVIGDGEEKYELKRLVNTLNVEDTFIFLGQKQNPYPYIKKGDYFALLSYFEGYGMVIEEAKILGKPVVITDTAAKEAVENYEKSFVLENDEEKIYEGLKQILLGKVF